MSSAPLLRINDLRTSFFTSDGEVRAVDGVSFDIEDGRTVGLVGESGCGKSVTALSIIRLLDKGIGRITGGEVLYRGTNLAGLPEAEMRRIRGYEISMVFQDPTASLTPVLAVGDQITEVLRVKLGLGAQAARTRGRASLVAGRTRAVVVEYKRPRIGHGPMSFASKR